MSLKPQILIVEDEKPIRKFIRVSLETQGYECIEASDGSNAITLVYSMNPDIIILDLGLPDMDGIEVIRKIREFKDTPIIIVSARGQDRDKIDALDLGADDYLSKPFSMGELLARVRVLLRRVGRNKESSEIVNNYNVDGLEVDLEKRRIMIQGGGGSLYTNWI